MSRPHPFDLVFGELADTTFPRVVTESSPEDVDIATFAKLGAVQELVSTLGVPELAEQNAQALEEYLRLIYVAYRYWRSGQQTYDVERAGLDSLLGQSAPALRSSEFTPCYLRLPERWFWAQIDEASPHEPLDGLFATPAGAGQVTAVAVLGLRSERGGFSQISVTATDTDVEAAPHTVRKPLFAPLMAGGTEAGFRSIASLGELLYLAHLALRSATL
jgi:hypothetical protein